MMRVIGTELVTPHVALGLHEEEGLRILGAYGEMVHDPAPDNCYSVHTTKFATAIYVTDSMVTSVWFDDPAGRRIPGGKARKVKSYLKRYGRLEEWEMRMDNGWMQYWFNDKEGIQMVYGIHQDVIRFNLLQKEEWHQNTGQLGHTVPNQVGGPNPLTAHDVR